MTFAELLQNNYIFLDGGMGTMLQARGMQAGERPELLNLKDPALVEQVQRAYVEAGSNIICSNTFGANRTKLTGSGATVQQVIPEGPDVFHVNAHRKRRKGAGHQTVAMADVEMDIRVCGEARLLVRADSDPGVGFSHGCLPVRCYVCHLSLAMVRCD